MRRSATSLLLLLLVGLQFRPLFAQRPIIQPSHGSIFEGPALSLECVATLKSKGEAGLVEEYRSKSPSERRICLDQLLRSLTLEPDFTPEEFQRSLKPNGIGGYNLEPDPSIDRRLFGRLGVNEAVARGVAELATKHLIDDPSRLRPLIECQNHPLYSIGKACNNALVELTLHTYGLPMFNQSMGAPAFTEENRANVVEDWRNLDALLKKGHPIFDESLASECESAIRALVIRLMAVLPTSPAQEYLGSLIKRRATQASPWGPIIRFNAGSDTAANWSVRDSRLSRIAFVIVRPSLAKPTSAEMPYTSFLSGFPVSDYQEVFPALDLEFRFAIGTTDESLRQAVILEVREALAGLRAFDARH